MNRRTFLATLAIPVVAAAGYALWRSSNNPYYNGPVSDHFDGTRFYIKGLSRDTSRLDLIRWRLFGERATWPDSFPSPHSDTPPARVADSIRISYVGHASILIQAHGVNMLIDPVWSERASPFQWVGPARKNPPGIEFEKLPPINAVLISHNHYDHLDLATLSRLAKPPGGKRPLFLAPLGNDAIMQVSDPDIVTQAHDWGAKVELGKGVSVHFEPSYHWSARGALDRRMALWASFVIETPSGKIYHIADTAYGEGKLFSDAKEKHGPFKLAILPIGAYEPRWFMKKAHINPDESVKIFQACGAEQAMAHHWGTFPLTDEPHDEPPKLLAKALEREKIPAEKFKVLRPGQVMEIS